MRYRARRVLKNLEVRRPSVQIALPSGPKTASLWV